MLLSELIEIDPANKPHYLRSKKDLLKMKLYPYFKILTYTCLAILAVTFFFSRTNFSNLRISVMILGAAGLIGEFITNTKNQVVLYLPQR